MMINFPVDFKKLSDVVDKKVVKKDMYDKMVRNFDTSSSQYISDIEDKIPSITSLATTTVVTVVKNTILTGDRCNKIKSDNLCINRLQ